ncbi:replication initiation negative regulator SeqA [Alteromonas sp. ASW11-130]|uniref:replication initiation negative regulator SeqA n=1 Tax=Alteromonas sp. ASW11-130 TaxID=3015775 RepID=UPI002241FFD9|nr:replication initiation negative regulator SeqA [Alteromonas sp. ASW11-130]MCW8090657.1 replication initiation negative regulator SeqA [Alteromonas sp. ASW11-130]
MKTIDIDDDLYAFIAGQTKHIGESASDILRRLLMPETPPPVRNETPPKPVQKTEPEQKVGSMVPDEARVSSVGSDDILEKISETELAQFTKRVDQFLFVLAQLFQIHGDEFGKVEQIRGKNRIYFAQSKEALLENGSSTNPKAIPDSPFWVVTNNNSAKKVAMLKEVLETLGYNHQIINEITGRFAPETVEK